MLCPIRAKTFKGLSAKRTTDPYLAVEVLLVVRSSTVISVGTEK
jgi:hypothetical protein